MKGRRNRRRRTGLARFRNRKPMGRCARHAMDQGRLRRALIDTILREELALAELIYGEARKTKSLAANMSGPFTPNEVIEFQHSVAAVLEKVVLKEKLLLNKLRLLLHWREHENGDDEWVIPDE